MPDDDLAAVALLGGDAPPRSVPACARSSSGPCRDGAGSCAHPAIRVPGEAPGPRRGPTVRPCPIHVPNARAGARVTMRAAAVRGARTPLSIGVCAASPETAQNRYRPLQLGSARTAFVTTEYVGSGALGASLARPPWSRSGIDRWSCGPPPSADASSRPRLSGEGFAGLEQRLEVGQDVRPAFADVLEDSAAGFEPVVHHRQLDRFSDWLKLEGHFRSRLAGGLRAEFVIESRGFGPFGCERMPAIGQPPKWVGLEHDLVGVGDRGPVLVPAVRRSDPPV